MEPRVLERPQHPVSRRDIDPNVLKVLHRLIGADHIAYLVGGGVRDLMMGRRPKDFDIATSAHPHQVRELFRNSRLIGRRFRLVHVFFGQQNIEVATFRRHSEELDGDDPLIRHDNTFGTPREDAFRRDFTVNALFYDPRTFRVIDYTGGISDLTARLIRTVGPPELRMREDPVRMMRAVRFAAKLDFEIEPATRAAIEHHRQDLLRASVPRLVEEIYRTFSLSGADRALQLMQQVGLLEVLLPPLSLHLGSRNGRLEEAATMRNVSALGRTVADGVIPSHALILASLFLDLYLDQARSPGGGAVMRDLLIGLRGHGFSRADSERMRHLLEAFVQMLTPSRRMRRLALRPYFSEALRFYGMIAPNYAADPAMLRRYLDESGRQPLGHSAEQPGALSSTGPGRRRRRRRGARRHRRRIHELLRPGVNGDPQGNPGAGDVAGSRAADRRNQAKLGDSLEPSVTPPR